MRGFLRGIFARLALILPLLVTTSLAALVVEPGPAAAATSARAWEGARHDETPPPAKTASTWATDVDADDDGDDDFAGVGAEPLPAASVARATPPAQSTARPGPRGVYRRLDRPPTR